MNATERLICALDVDSVAQAVALVQTLSPHVGVFKVGLEFVTSAGVQGVAQLRDAGAERLFYDGKLHDIPNTVAGAMRGVVRLGAWCVTVHAGGGAAMLRAAVQSAHEEAAKTGLPRPRVLAVTVLTSIGAGALANELHVGLPLPEYVRALALMAREAGCDGVIASPHEIAVLRAALPDPEFLIVTPGVRPVGMGAGDQARVMTPSDAMRAGASYLVVGRAITGDSDPSAAAQRIASEMAEAMGAQTA